MTQAATEISCSRKLDFRSYAVASSRASRMALISADVGWSGRVSFNLAVIMTRRSLAVMSAVDGSALRTTLTTR
jgi:hypothetical protein